MARGVSPNKLHLNHWVIDLIDSHPGKGTPCHMGDKVLGDGPSYMQLF